MLYILKNVHHPYPLHEAQCFLLFQLPNFFSSVGNFSPAMGARPASQCSLATQFQTRFMELIPRPIAVLYICVRMLFLLLTFPKYLSRPFNLFTSPFQPFFRPLSTFLPLTFHPFFRSLSAVFTTPFSFSSFSCLQYFSSLSFNISSCPCQSYLLPLSAFLPPLQTFLSPLPFFPYNHSFI
jgi:hypothetical protein